MYLILYTNKLLLADLKLFFFNLQELDLTTSQVSDTEFSSTFDLVMSRSCAVTALIGYFDCFFDKDLSHKVCTVYFSCDKLCICS